MTKLLHRDTSGTPTELFKAVLFGDPEHAEVGNQSWNTLFYQLINTYSGTDLVPPIAIEHVLRNRSWINEALLQIENLIVSEPDADFDPPNELAKKNARRLVYLMKKIGIRPVSIGPCPDDGVTFSFVVEEKLGAIETSNTGEIFVVVTEKYGRPQIREISSSDSDLESAIEEIAFHLGT